MNLFINVNYCLKIEGKQNKKILYKYMGIKKLRLIYAILKCIINHIIIIMIKRKKQ